MMPTPIGAAEKAWEDMTGPFPDNARKPVDSVECTCYVTWMIPRNQPSPSRVVCGMPDLSALFHDLVRFEIELWNAVDARLRADCDLLLSRFEPLQVISRRSPCRVQDIADELSITVGGASKLVDRIEVAG